MTNAKIVEIFQSITDLLTAQRESVFKVRAYQKAIRTIELLPVELSQMVEDGEDLERLSGVGKAIAKKIQELVTTGRLDYYERLEGEAASPQLRPTVDTDHARA